MLTSRSINQLELVFHDLTLAIQLDPYRPGTQPPQLQKPAQDGMEQDYRILQNTDPGVTRGGNSSLAHAR